MEKTLIKKILTLGAVSALTLTGITYTAFAENGGGGTGEGGTGGGNQGTASVIWHYKEAYEPATRATVEQVLREDGYPNLGRTQDNQGIDNAINAARQECEQSYRGEGSANCRMVGIGYGAGILANGTHAWNIDTWINATEWTNVWNRDINPNTYYYQGQPYQTDKTWIDNFGNRSVNIMVANSIARKPDAAIRIIMLAQNQPPVNYPLTVTTQHQAQPNLKVGATTPITDQITTSNGNSSIQENIQGTITLTYDGQQNGYVKPKTASKPFTAPNKATTTSPQFTPADFGMKHWQEGKYWFDIDVPKQGHMTQAVNTNDREPTETYEIYAESPNITDQEKTIEKGTSASQMVNTTTITTDTGKGGYELKITDHINPNGVKYTISNMKVTDTTDNKNVSDQYTMKWDQTQNTVTATRTADKGELPLNHQITFTFDVTVDKPDFNKIQDYGKIKWNQHPEVELNHREFPTWQPNPDKAWIIQKDGKWQAVIDPQKTNNVGADKNQILDQTRVASIVNTTVPADLIDIPKQFIITDDYTKADYIFDADSTSQMRVYAQEATTDKQSSITNIVNTGKNITNQFTITQKGTIITAQAKPEYLKTLQGLKKPLQISLLVPGKTNYANKGGSQGATQVRKDFNKKETEEVNFCTNPPTNGETNNYLTNSGSEQINNHKLPTNEPYICGYIPPVVKDVVSEASQGGSQESVNGKIVYPKQKVEYQLTTEPRLPAKLQDKITEVTILDEYDPYLTVDKQTLEITDLTTGKTIPKREYTTRWDDKKHQFQATFSQAYIQANWQAGQHPRIMVRFEGTVKADAPTTHKLGNQWYLKLNNSITPSNKVENEPPAPLVQKHVTQKDNSINIDGKTFLLGDKFNYRVWLDLTQMPKEKQAYKVWRAGITDDWDDKYLSLDEKNIRILNETGKDVTNAFNIQTRNGITYASAKTVDTYIDPLGITVKGDPQPTNLKTYSQKGYDPLKDPAIDQNLLGHKYQLVLPMTVKMVKDGYTVKNKAQAIHNDQKKETNEVTNPLTPINPEKDVVVNVGDTSINNTTIPLGSVFLYQLDSSTLPANRAYPEVTRWEITDPLPTEYDEYTGQWAVYANTDLYKDGKLFVKKGQRIAGSNFDTSKLGGELFTTKTNDKGEITISATGRMLALASANTKTDQAWRAYIQVKRIKVSEEVINKFTEHYNEKILPSNPVTTNTPDKKPAIQIEKYDKASGWPNGDRDQKKEALLTNENQLTIIYRITNTGDLPLEAIKLNDQTLTGNAKIEIHYPENWETRILQPNDTIEIEGTLTGINGEHQNRVTAEATPITECPYIDDDPFDDKPATKAEHCTLENIISNSDDWHAKQEPLANTGAKLTSILIGAILLTSLGSVLLVTNRRKKGNQKEKYDTLTA